MVPVIYGIGSKFLKTSFYNIAAVFYNGQVIDSMFSTRDPEYHKNLKRPVAQLFSMTNMKNYEPYADECTGLFIDAMCAVEGQVLDLGVWLQYYAFDVIAYITFQRRFRFLDERRDVDNMISDLDAVQGYLKLIGQIPWAHPYLLGNRILVGLAKMLATVPDPLYSFLKITEDEIHRYDHEGRTSQAQRTDFLAQIRQKTEKDGKITQTDMVNHLSNNIIAGSDTTAISLRAIFYNLMKHPQVYQKLQAEIDEADREGKLSPYVTYEECLRLPYLQAVMKEAMRVHPGVGLPLERYVPAEGATICGVFLPGGTNVFMSAPVLHSDKRVFGPDADLYRPERWIESSEEQLKVMERSFLAFGHGVRTCIGKNISILEMGKFVPQILRHLDVQWAGDKPEWDTHCNFFWKQTNMPVVFKVREKR
ncbi:hypothetical protein CLAIMM_09940 [Cladophialophora immunda]|nr:hypothetical protein CLAIMM_09940 [Cladophialophora immunda]